MAQTYTKLAPGATPTLGTSGDAVKAFQTNLNTQNAGVAGYTPLKVDGLYGPLTQAASIFKAPVVTTTSTNNPIISGTATKNDINALGNDINTMTNSAGLTASNEASNKILTDRLNQMEEDYKADIGGIKTAYEEADRIQTERQGRDYAGRATGLVTSGGGFLGNTQSHQGVLQNLTNTFTQEKNALMSKRDAALRAARDAHDSKAFDIAKEQLNLARETEKEIYNRQKDFADQKLALARENRAQTEFDMGLTDKKIQAYANMSDADFAKQNPEEIALLDKNYFTGYTTNKRAIEKKAQDIKTSKDAIALDSDILDMRLKMPAGQKFSLGGQTYTGLKSASSDGGTAGERQIALQQKISQLFNPGYTIPGSNGTPIIDNNGYATPEGWKAVIKISGMNRADFIKEYGYLISSEGIDKYGLTNPEKEIIQGKL